MIRMGKLRFSDGTQTEKAHKLTVDGKVVAFDARLPIGAMIGTTEAQERVMGGAGTGDANASNRHVADTLGVAHKSYRSGGKRRSGKGYNRDESAAMLADAIANTSVIPPIKRCPPGVACGTSAVADQFVGMRVNATGGGGSMAWGDIGSALADRDAWAAALAALKDEDKAAIDAAKTANGFGQVGASIGFNTGWSGKRALIAANDNLSRAYKKVS
ncbi:MAG: hypothetical protein HPM95_15180 [Alphaproteobacteria bacterium]|nr:hypothetical protein [Alphaproteobacteria bacterium]